MHDMRLDGGLSPARRSDWRRPGTHGFAVWGEGKDGRGSPACAGHDTELRRVAADALVSPRALTNDLYGQSNARGCPGPGSVLPVVLVLASMLRILVVPQPALATGTSQPSSAEAPRTAPHTGRRREPAAYSVGATQAS